MQHLARYRKKKNSQGILWFLMLLLLCPLWSVAQHYPMLHYTIKEGLASNTIYDIYKDPNGYFWLGTDKGISRFNGISFENFTTEDGLSDNECFFFRPDQYGRLWIGTYNGRLCYYQNGVFHNEKNTPWLKLPFRATQTIEIATNADSSITFYFHDDPRILEIKNRTVKIMASEITRKKHEDVFSILKYVRKISDNRYLFIYKREALIINFSTGVTELSVPIYPPVKSTTRKNGSLILVHENDVLSTINNNATLNYFRKCDFDPGVILYQLLCRGADTFLIANNGVTDNSGRNFKEVHSAFSAALYKQLLLVGTAKEGLFLFDLDGKIRNELNPKPEGNIDYAQLFNDKLLLLDKRNAISIYQSPSFQRIKSIAVHQYNQLIPTLNFIRKNYFYSICRDSYYRLSLTSNNFKLETIYDTSLRSNISNYVDHDTELITQIRRKIVRIDARALENKRWISVKAHFGIGADFESMFGFALDGDDSVWLSTVQKIYKLRGNNIIPQPQFGKLAFREMVFLKQCLVGITHDNQLVLCKNYTASAVLSDTLASLDCVWNKLIKMNDSTLFITTNNYPRLLQFFSATRKKSFRIRTLDNPFIPYQPEYLSATDSGIMMFAKGEMFLFPPKYLAGDKPIPAVHFSSLNSGSRKIPVTDTITLEFNDAQDLKISFRPIAFFNTTLTYEYSISSGGKNGKWIPFQGEELNLIKLFFGDHIIKVRAKTLSGEYSLPDTFLLKVKKPWWADWWFLLCCLLLLIVIISLAARWNIKRRLRKKENEVRFLISEYRSLNALMNPHFVFNSLNSLQSMVNNHETDPASRYIRIFSNLLRQNMHNMTHDLIPIAKEIDLIDNYLKLEKIRFKEKLNYKIELSPEADISDVFIPPLLIQPLVENAIKHGIWPMDSNNALLSISINDELNKICVRIKHNGAPLGTNPKSDTNHQSYAVENIRQRIEHLNQIHNLQITYSIYNIEQNNKITGVECKLCIPIIPELNNHYKSQNSIL